MGHDPVKKESVGLENLAQSGKVDLEHIVKDSGHRLRKILLARAVANSHDFQLTDCTMTNNRHCEKTQGRVLWALPKLLV